MFRALGKILDEIQFGSYERKVKEYMSVRLEQVS